ncbi:MAG: VWA domain-containing protein, partial [Anaerolineales bacterium]|nr:VWA domain-containing protein [Anaerolineales bacterium]
VADSNGTQIKIDENQLVDADGNAPAGDIMMNMYTYDLNEEEMVGDMSGTNTDGDDVYMESAGAFYASFEDDAGEEYNLADGATAEISIPVEEERPDEVLTVWSYDPETGLWVEEGVATLEDGRYVAEVSHFSYWNFDWEKSNPACIKLDVEPDYLAANKPLQVRAILQTTPVSVRNLDITDPVNVLINLPENTEVKFYMAPDYAVPFETKSSSTRWGGVGTPAYPYDDCNSTVTIVPPPTTGTLQGVKFQDTNNNGVKDADEPGLPGWTIEIRDAAGALTTMVTDDAGFYQVELPVGNYTVSEVQQDGWTQTLPAGGAAHSVSVQSGATANNIDFGNYYANVCQPLDVVFVIDVTASMGPAIAGVKGELNTILNDISGASGGDYQLGLVTFNDNVFVLDDLAAGNLTSVKEHINSLTADGGVGYPEASDESLNTVLNGLDAGDARPQQTGDFNGTWRPNARKHIILVTNEVPGGFDDTYSDADKTNAENLALVAKDLGIQIDAIYVPGAQYAEAETIMQNYASTTGGTYFKTVENGSDAASEIRNIVTDCSEVDSKPLYEELEEAELQGALILTGIVVGHEAQVGGSVQTVAQTELQAGFTFQYIDPITYAFDYPIAGVTAGENTKPGLIIGNRSSGEPLIQAVIWIATSSETEVGAAAVQKLVNNSVPVTEVRVNNPIIEGDIIEVTLQDDSSSDMPYTVKFYRGESRELIAEIVIGP